jgi:hypothetical protein
MFQMKDPRVAKTNLGHKNTQRQKHGKLWLSQQKSMKKILMKFNMNILKPINISLDLHCNISLSCRGSKEEKVMSHVLHGDIVGRLMFAMECSNISHVVGVVSGHYMEKPGEDHGNECFSVLEE